MNSFQLVLEHIL